MFVCEYLCRCYKHAFMHLFTPVSIWKEVNTFMYVTSNCGNGPTDFNLNFWVRCEWSVCTKSTQCLFLSAYSHTNLKDSETVSGNSFAFVATPQKCLTNNYLLKFVSIERCVGWFQLYLKCPRDGQIKPSISDAFVSFNWRSKKHIEET